MRKTKCEVIRGGRHCFGDLEPGRIFIDVNGLPFVKLDDTLENGANAVWIDNGELRCVNPLASVEVVSTAKFYVGDE